MPACCYYWILHPVKESALWYIRVGSMHVPAQLQQCLFFGTIPPATDIRKIDMQGS
jgi:hypothetical protein